MSPFFWGLILGIILGMPLGVGFIIFLIRQFIDAWGEEIMDP